MAKPRHFLRGIAQAGVLAALAAGAWGFGVEPGWLRERRLKLDSADWQGPPLTIALASDLHVGAPHAGPEMVARLVAGIQAAHPDLILLTGDFIADVLGGRQLPPEEIAPLLAGLEARLGVYATLGNHDWRLDGERMKAALEGVGIRVLDNAAVPLPLSGPPVWLAGIGNGSTNADVARTYAAIPADAQVVAMMHDPANAPELPRGAVAFAGHTHGGQVRVPFLGALYVPGPTPLRHAYGWIPGVRVPTYVTSGVGTSTLPVRFNCPPEYVILRLTGKGA